MAWISRGAGYAIGAMACRGILRLTRAVGILYSAFLVLENRLNPYLSVRFGGIPSDAGRAGVGKLSIAFTIFSPRVHSVGEFPVGGAQPRRLQPCIFNHFRQVFADHPGWPQICVATTVT